MHDLQSLNRALVFSMQRLHAGKPHTSEPQVWQLPEDGACGQRDRHHGAVEALLRVGRAKRHLQRVFWQQQRDSGAGYPWTDQWRHLRCQLYLFVFLPMILYVYLLFF